MQPNMLSKISSKTMKRTSSSLKQGTIPARKRPNKTQATDLSEEQQVLAFLKEMGAKPMSTKTRKLMAEAGCLGMPEEL
jgi:hypothetical protein